ncbi:MAG: hypothetical protein ABL864_10145 [Terricaulis sp.]
MIAERQPHQIHRLVLAEIQFRLASAVRIATSLEEQPLDLPTEWAHGKHTVRYEEVALRPDQAEVAAQLLQQSATFIMATTIRGAVLSAVGDAKNSADQNVRCAYQIARMIRNAFAHDPMRPTWSIDQDCRDQVFEVPEVIRFDTRDIDGCPLKWTDYGGPLAILRLGQFVRFDILQDERRESRPFPPPKNVIVQQGNLILRKIDRLPDGVVPVELPRTEDGGYRIDDKHVIYSKS